MQNAAYMAARLQQQLNICQAAEMEDQLHEQMKMQCTNFQNPTSAVTRSLKPQSIPKTAPDGAISSGQTLPQGHAEGDGESQEVKTEKGISTIIHETNVRILTLLISIGH